MKKSKFVQSIAILTMMSSSLMTCPSVLANNVHKKATVASTEKISAMKAKPIITANNFATTPSNNTSIKAVINYQYNGKTISSYTENVQPDASIDINSHLPQGYQTPNGYTPQANFPVQNGVATINVPIVPISTSSSDSGNINVTINYTYNGKTVGTGTETIANGSTIDVSKELPKGYEVSSAYTPSSNIPVQDGKATIEVPVTPASSSTSSSQGEKMVIDYVDPNGNQVGTATVNVQSGQPVDVTKTLPKGYALSPDFKPQDNIQVVNGVATVKVPVVKQDLDSSSNVSSTNNSSNSSLTTPNDSSSSKASVSKNNPDIPSSAVDSSESSTSNSEPTSNVNNSETSNSNSSSTATNNSSTSADTSNSSSVGTSSTSTSNASSATSNNTVDNGTSSVDNGGNQKQDDDSSSSVVTGNTNNGGNQKQDDDSSSSVVTGSTNNGSNQKQTNDVSGDKSTSSQQNNNSQQNSSSDKKAPTVSATEGVKDMNGDTNAKKINYTDDKGNVIKSVPTTNGKANSNDIQSNLPVGASLDGATVNKDSNGNLNVSLPQTGEKTRNNIITAFGAMLVAFSGMVTMWIKTKFRKN